MSTEARNHGIINFFRRPFSHADRGVRPISKNPPKTEARTSQIPELTAEDIERWKNLPRKIISYEAGVCKDGITHYQGGEMLLIGEEGKEEQVMDTFELPWVKDHIRQMWKGRGGRPQDVAECGFGLGLMSEEIHERMKTSQRTRDAQGVKGTQKHIIIELNKQVFGDAKEWAKRKQEEASAEGRSVKLVFVDDKNNRQVEEIPVGVDTSNIIEITVFNRDADQVLSLFPPQSFDQISSDTHQLRPEHLGVHDILDLKIKKTVLKAHGVFAFIPWNRNNLTGKLDKNQLVKISSDDFEEITITSGPEVIVHPYCEYLPEGKSNLSTITCHFPRYNRFAA